MPRRTVKTALKELAAAPQGDNVTRARMDLEHAFIATGGSVMESRVITKRIDDLIRARLEEMLEP